MIDRIFVSPVEFRYRRFLETVPSTDVEVLLHESCLQRSLSDRKKVGDVGVYHIERPVYSDICETSTLQGVVQMFGIRKPVLPRKSFSSRFSKHVLVNERLCQGLPE